MMNEETFFSLTQKSLIDLIKKDPSVLKSYHTSELWTPIIQSLIEGILHEEEPTLEIKREYYRVDTLARQDLKSESEQSANGIMKVNGHDFWIYKRKIHYLVEYENNKKSWADEVDKLSHLRANLKVLFTYSEGEKTKETYLKTIEAKLAAVTQMMSEAEPAALDDSWLLIFLPSEELDLNLLVGFKMMDHHFVQL
jgi:hypothetical protein